MKKSKLEVLRMYFHKYLDSLFNAVWKTTKDPTLMGFINTVKRKPEKLIDEFLIKFIQACSLKYQIAFFQWRDMFRPNASVSFYHFFLFFC